MKAQFRAYYAPTPEEFERLWSDAVIVFDANALLNFFRYSATTRDEWLDLLKKEKDRLWLPHQVALEFHRNRRLVAHQQEKAFAEVEKSLSDAEVSIRSSIDGLRRHPTLEAEELSQLIERHMKKVRKKFKRARSRHFRAVISQDAHDKTLGAISAIYDGSVGEPYSAAELSGLYKEGSERYARKIPPGYMDEAEKKGDEKYGDLVLWRQTLDHGAEVKKPLIFVTDDAKEDWWMKSSGKIFGPRPELVAEYYEVAGERAHFYQPRAFLKFANERGEKISAEAIAEARSVSAVRNVKARYPTEAVRSALDTIARSQATLGRDALSDATRVGLAEYRRLIESSNAGPEALARIREALTGMTVATSATSALRMLAEEEEERRNTLYRRAFQDLNERGNIASYLASLEGQEETEDDADSPTGDEEHNES